MCKNDTCFWYTAHSQYIAPLLDLKQTQLCQTSMQHCDWTKFNEYSCSSVISISVGKWNKRQLQTLQIDNTWSKKLNCINLNFMLKNTSSVMVTTITKHYKLAFSICNLCNQCLFSFWSLMNMYENIGHHNSGLSQTAHS